MNDKEMDGDNNNGVSEPSFNARQRATMARRIFQLIRKKYEHSKRLNVLKRYRAMKKIISVVTSEAVIQRLATMKSEEAQSQGEAYTQSEGDAQSLENIDEIVSFPDDGGSDILEIDIVELRDEIDKIFEEGKRTHSEKSRPMSVKRRASRRRSSVQRAFAGFSKAFRNLGEYIIHFVSFSTSTSQRCKC